MAFAILTDLHLAIGIFATASVVVAVMFHLERRDTLPTDSLLGLLAHGGLALGLVTLSFFPNMRLDLAALLFGDILAVSRLDLALIWAGGAVALGVLAWLWRPLLAATVRRFATSPEKMAVGAALAGVVAVVGGLLASANWDTPSGPSIVVAALVLFVVTRVGRPRRRATAPLSRGGRTPHGPKMTAPPGARKLSAQCLSGPCRVRSHISGRPSRWARGMGRGDLP